MNPIVPILMTFGAILFFVGLSVQIRSFKKTRTIKFFGKEYGLWRIVLTTITSGVALIMISVYIQKILPPEPEMAIEKPQVTLSSNLKYELTSILPSDENNTRMMNAINRFQDEYHEALEEDDKKTMELLAMEMAFLVREKLEKQDYPSHQINSEVDRIMHFLKQKPSH